MGRKKGDTRPVFRGRGTEIIIVDTDRQQKFGPRPANLSVGKLSEIVAKEIAQKDPQKDVKRMASGIVKLWANDGSPRKAKEFWSRHDSKNKYGFFQGYAHGSAVLAFCGVADLERQSNPEFGLYSPIRRDATTLVAETIADVIGGFQQLVILDEGRIEPLFRLARQSLQRPFPEFTPFG